MSQTGGLKKSSKTTFSNNFSRTQWEKLSAMFLGKLLNLTNASFLSLYSHMGAKNLFLLPREENLLSVTYNFCYILTLPFLLFLGSLNYLYSFGNSVFFYRINDSLALITCLKTFSSYNFQTIFHDFLCVYVEICCPNCSSG